MNKIKAIFFIAVFVIYSSGAFSQDIDKKIEDEFKWLQEETVIFTEIATKTKMDSDLVPGMVTVLTGETLEKKGYRTVIEAMNLVPGFMRGAGSVVVRGIGEVYASGKVKMLLNGVPMNDTLSGTCSPLYNIPIQQVEKIEIIRGPGSAIYGKWAYSAVINVVTKQDGNRVFIQYGSFDTFSAGGLVSYSQPEKDFKISLNISHWNRNRSGLISGPDILYGSPNESISIAPGPVDDSVDSTNGIFQVSYKDVSLSGQYISTTAGDSFGFIGALPPLDDEDRREIDTFSTIKLKWSPKLTSSIDMNFNVGLKKSIYDESNAYLYPPGFSIPDVIVYENGMIGGPYYEEGGIDSGMELHFKGWKNHKIMAGWEYEHVKIMDVWSRRNYELSGMPLSSPQRFTGEGNWIDENKSRDIFAIFMQDQFEVTETLTFTTGLRYDYYDDTSDRLSPRIAVVFHPFEKHIFKAQYAESFRPPAFLEMYAKNNPVVSGNTDMAPEVIKTTELGYIFKAQPVSAKLTIFYSYLDNLITQDGFQYLNSGGAILKGAETEMEWQISNSLMLYGNLSYVKTKDKDTDTEIRGSSNWIGNIGLTYEPVEDYLLSVQYFYCGDRNRDAADIRPDVDKYHMVNIAATSENLFLEGLTLRMGIKNLFDEDIRYPSFDYIEDYPTSGYEIWGQISYDF
ncbi:MAG: TonB-dependent receptor [Desulfobacterales bacterium]|nr:TonB-dependent receptor [Desulfobacterales bacterium]